MKRKLGWRTKNGLEKVNWSWTEFLIIWKAGWSIALCFLFSDVIQL